MNYKALREMIDTRHINVSALASDIGINKTSMYNKIEGKTEFKLSEIRDITRVLRLTDAERDKIFFA